MEIPARASSQQRRVKKKRGEVGAGAVQCCQRNTGEKSHKCTWHSREEKRGQEVGGGGDAFPDKPLLSLLECHRCHH